jgi:flagellar hook-associated protein 3 FlgL
MNYQLRTQEFWQNQTENQMASQQRVQNLRDDPVAAAQATRYQSWAERLAQYDKNSLEVQSNLRIQESHMSQAQSILQRINELTIQGANGTYSKDDMKAMGVEVNEYLEELVSIANAKGPDGQSLFAGTKVDSNAFRPIHGHVQGGDGQVVVQVEYTGSIGETNAEISEGSQMPTNFPGNQVFWADQQKIYSAADSQNYSVPADSTIVIDGKPIDLRAGDNVHSVIAKINAAPVAVKASLDPVSNGLVLETTEPHQIQVDDKTGGTVLRDLGIVSPRPGVRPPHNIQQDARVFGGSMFDAVIRLRDNLMQGNKDFIGGQGLAGVQASMANLQTNLAELGARDSRLEFVSKSLEDQRPKVIEKLSNAIDLDLTDGITRLKMMETTHQAALRTAAKILPPTLMDYLR